MNIRFHKHIYLIFIIFLTMNVIPSLSLKVSRCFTNPVLAFSKRRALFMSTTSNPVKSMNVQQFKEILNGKNRSNYQIIDVREKNELLESALSGEDVMNLPTNDANIWQDKILKGELLDSSKPTLCMCKMGGRSLKAATFLGKYRITRTYLCVFTVPF